MQTTTKKTRRTKKTAAQVTRDLESAAALETAEKRNQTGTHPPEVIAALTTAQEAPAAQVDPTPAPIPAEPPRQIVTRFYGRCKACGATIPPGCRALYQHATKRITCVDCEHPARPAIRPETAKAREMAEALPF